MKILVSAKRVTDPYTTLVLKSDGSGLDLDDVDYKMNPFCEIAVEEALRIIDEFDNVVQRIPDVQTEARGNLVVSASARVNSAPHFFTQTLRG